MSDQDWLYGVNGDYPRSSSYSPEQEQHIPVPSPFHTQNLSYTSYMHSLQNNYPQQSMSPNQYSHPTLAQHHVLYSQSSLAQNLANTVLTPAMSSSSYDDSDWPLPSPDKAKQTDSCGITPFVNLRKFCQAEDVLNNPMDHQTLFRDATMAADFRASLGQEQATDITIPVTPAQKRACVLLLFKAFKSVADASDNAQMKAKFLQQGHNNHRVECMCWDLLAAIIRRSEIGPLMAAYDENKVIQTPNLSNFADRLNAVVLAMSKQKTICKHLLDAPYVNIFVDDPEKASNRVTSNRELNKKKSEVMSAGKKELQKSEPPQTPKRKRAKQTEESDFEDDWSSANNDSPYKPPSRILSSRRSGRSNTRKGNNTPSSTGSGSYIVSPLVKHEQSLFNVPTIGMRNGYDSEQLRRIPPMSYVQPDHSAFPFEAGHGSATNFASNYFHGSTPSTLGATMYGNQDRSYVSNGSYPSQPDWNEQMVSPLSRKTGFGQTQTSSFYNARPSTPNNFNNDASPARNQHATGRRGAISNPIPNKSDVDAIEATNKTMKENTAQQ